MKNLFLLLIIFTFIFITYSCEKTPTIDKNLDIYETVRYYDTIQSIQEYVTPLGTPVAYYDTTYFVNGKWMRREIDNQAYWYYYSQNISTYIGRVFQKDSLTLVEIR